MATILKTSYQDSYNKRAARNEVFSGLKAKKIVGLAGPDLYGCVKEYEKAGFEDITIYENDKKILLLQLPQLQKVSVNYRFEDIISAPFEKDVAYDLDFCSHLSSVEKYVRKFTNNFILTVSERGLTRFASMGLFLRLRDEHFKNKIHINENLILVESDKGKYIFRAYHDTSPMLMIHRI